MELPAISVSQSPEEKFREYLASRPRPQRSYAAGYAEADIQAVFGG